MARVYQTRHKRTKDVVGLFERDGLYMITVNRRIIGEADNLGDAYRFYNEILRQ